MVGLVFISSNYLAVESVPINSESAASFSMSLQPKRICVVGGGVNGLSCAIRLREHGHQVTIIARDEGDRTTSSIAAAFWYPFAPGKIPVHTWYKHEWAVRSYQVFQDLVDTSGTGISETYLYEYFTDDLPDDEVQGSIEAMWWRKHKDIPNIQFRPLAPSEFAGKRIREFQIQAGISFRTFVINMSDYLTYLRRRVDELAISFNFLTLTEITPLLDEFDRVVNCSGLGAKALEPKDRDPVTGEHRLRPVEGVVVSIGPMEAVNDIILIHCGDYFGNLPMYIVPRSGSHPDLILGGSTTSEIDFDTPERKAYLPQHLPWNSLDAEHWTKVDTDRIVADCSSFEQKITSENPERLMVKVGYRPSRDPEVRLERDGNVIHNYGHAGAGVTLSWGCAEAVADLIDQ
ncbi:MAG TPA: FAD-dependent oxidoreductase [Pyrinomonadaceae bacterium]|nr:FAD-dependent oxidoreductase [Pyrinomonadaceae bacterium]